MRIALMVAFVAAAQVAEAPRVSRIPAGRASLYARDIGHGQPAIVLHGGPDFDISYLLPDLDRLTYRFRLIYYDQRGRGKSAAGVRPEDVSLASDVADVGRVMEHFKLPSAVLLGHSWGTVLALEYAIRNPARVSHLILMNPAPASASDFTLLRTEYVRTLGDDFDRQRQMLASAAYKAGDPAAVAARYRLHFKPALSRPADYEKLMAAMKAAFAAQGSAGILKARTVEDRLMRETWEMDGYDLMPKLRTLSVPTLIVYGDHDFIPAEIGMHIARALPNARLVTLRDCGHFAYMECPADVRKTVNEFFFRPPQR